MTDNEELAQLQGYIDLYRADQGAAHAIIDALGVGEQGANLRVRLPLAIRAVERAERAQHKQLEQAARVLIDTANTANEPSSYVIVSRAALEALRKAVEG